MTKFTVPSSVELKVAFVDVIVAFVKNKAGAETLKSVMVSVAEPNVA